MLEDPRVMCPRRTQHEGQSLDESVWRSLTTEEWMPPGKPCKGEQFWFHVFVPCEEKGWVGHVNGALFIMGYCDCFRRRLRMKEMYIMHELRLWLKGVEYLCFMFLVCKLPRQCPIHLCVLRTQCWTQSNVLCAPQTSTANKVKITSSIGQQERSVQVNIWKEF